MIRKESFRRRFDVFHPLSQARSDFWYLRPAAGGQWLAYSLLLKGQAASGDGIGRIRIR